MSRVQGRAGRRARDVNGDVAQQVVLLAATVEQRRDRDHGLRSGPAVVGVPIGNLDAETEVFKADVDIPPPATPAGWIDVNAALGVLF
jgi:hypothetical protein